MKCHDCGETFNERGGKDLKDLKETIRVARDFVNAIPEYNKIFGRSDGNVGPDGESALIDKMDIVLTSGGPCVLIC